jgi:hypothetical protein
MKRNFCRGILCAAVLGFAASLQGQSNVYSLAIYSAGNSYADLCSLSFPFPPYVYKLEEHSWYEDARGLTIMDLNHRNERDGILRRLLEVQCGSNSFSVPFGPAVPTKGDAAPPGSTGAGNLAAVVVNCLTNRGGHVTAGDATLAPWSWVLHSREAEDIIIVRVTTLMRFKNF